MVDNVGAAIRFNTTIRHHESTGSQPDSSSDNHECRWGIGSFWWHEGPKKVRQNKKMEILVSKYKWEFLNFSVYFLFIHLNINCEGHQTMAWPLTILTSHDPRWHLFIIRSHTHYTGAGRSGGEFPYLIKCLGHNVRRHQLPGELSPRARPGQLRIKKIIKIWGWCISLPRLTGW